MIDLWCSEKHCCFQDMQKTQQRKVEISFLLEIIASHYGTFGAKNVK